MPPVSQGGNELTTRRAAFAVVALVVAFAIGATSAHAVPSSKLEQARAVKSKIDRLDQQVSVADERYLQASLKHAKIAKEKKQVERKLRKVTKRMGVVQTHLNVRAGSMYRSGQMAFVQVLVGAESFEEFAATWDVLKDLNKDDAASIAELKDLRAEAKRTRRKLVTKEKAAAKQVAIMRANKNAIQAKLSARRSELAGLEAEINALENAERRARTARAASFTSSPSRERRFPPPTRAPRSGVVGVARRYLGAPYVWAASGPNSFDCSGFTMFVYRQVGVSLPHSSRAQIGYGQRVSRGNLQAGDLVFFGSPIHHVGIYVGGGMMIHAPHSGAVVRIDPLHSNYSGATRP